MIEGISIYHVTQVLLLLVLFIVIVKLLRNP